MKFNTGAVFKVLFALATAVALSACASNGPRSVTAHGVSTATLEDALAAYEQSQSRESLLLAIHMLEGYAQSHPTDYTSRARLTNAYTLLGAGYSQSGRDKAMAYRLALEYGEAALMTDVSYREAREAGQSFEEALQYLNLQQIEALVFWKTAMFYSFREAPNFFAKLIRYPRLKRAVAVMEHIDKLDPTVYAGNNLMSLGIYYLALPEFYGGDNEKSAAYFMRAANVSDRNITPRWARAKYYAVAFGDREMFQSDLNWVASQSLDDLVGPRPWNVVLLREARVLLDSQAKFFEESS